MDLKHYHHNKYMHELKGYIYIYIYILRRVCLSILSRWFDEDLPNLFCLLIKLKGKFKQLKKNVSHKDGLIENLSVEVINYRKL